VHQLVNKRLWRPDSISLLSHYFSTQFLPRLRRSSYLRSFSHPSGQLPCPASPPTVTQLFPPPDRGNQDFASKLDIENRSTPCFKTTALFFCDSESRDARGNESWPTCRTYWCFHKANVYTKPYSNRLRVHYRYSFEIGYMNLRKKRMKSDTQLWMRKFREQTTECLTRYWCSCLSSV